MDAPAFGKKLREIREQRRVASGRNPISQAAIAAELGVTNCIISDVELGRRTALSGKRIYETAQFIGEDPEERYAAMGELGVAAGHITASFDAPDERRARVAVMLIARWPDFDDNKIEELERALAL